MTLEQMGKALGMSKMPECFTGIYECIAQDYTARAAYILSDSFITETLEQSGVMLPYKEEIFASAREIRHNESLCLLVCLLEQWVLSGGNVAAPDYEEPKITGPAWDFLHLFPALPTIPQNVAEMRRRGVPEDVIADTMGEYDYCVALCIKRINRPAFMRDRLNWICRLIRGKLIHIGRLKYDLPGTYMTGFRVYENSAGELTVLANDLQIHRSGSVLGSVGCKDPEGSFLAQIEEAENTISGYPFVGGRVQKDRVVLQKADWKLRLCEKDPVLRIHIPPGGDFAKQTLADTYQRTREVMANCYPDHPFKAFFCSSWLMSLDLPEVLKPESNILGFQRDFTPVPFRGGDGTVFSFVFGTGGVTPEKLPTLPENTSLQRAVKRRYLDGGYIREGAGFFF